MFFLPTKPPPPLSPFFPPACSILLSLDPSLSNSYTLTHNAHTSTLTCDKGVLLQLEAALVFCSPSPLVPALLLPPLPPAPLGVPTPPPDDVEGVPGAEVSSFTFF